MYDIIEHKTSDGSVILYIKGMYDWEDFDKVLSEFKNNANIKCLKEIDGPDSRVAFLETEKVKFKLTFCDMMGVGFELLDDEQPMEELKILLSVK